MKTLLFANIGTDDLGYYHVGDEAMWLETWRFYHQLFPHVQLSALVSRPLYAHLEVKEQLNLPWPDDKKTAQWYFVTTLVKALLWKHFRLPLLNSDQKQFIQFISDQDLVHFTGGGNITSECNHWLYYALLVIVVARILNKPVILTSQSIGPFSSLIDLKITMWVLNLVSYISLREYTNRNTTFLKMNGVQSPKIRRSLDSAYFTQTKPLNIFPRQPNTIRIGLSIHPRHQNPKVLLSLLQRLLPKITHHFKQVEILLLPHVVNKHKHWDRGFMENLLKRVTPPMPVISPAYELLIKNDHLPPIILKSLTTTCDLVITTRYHGAIFALSSNTPCFSLVDGDYQQMKNLETTRFMFKKLAHFFVIDIHSPQAAEKLVHRAINLLNRSNFQKSIRQHMQRRNKQLFPLSMQSLLLRP